VKRKSGRPTALELKPGASGKFAPRRFPPLAKLPPKAKPPKRKGTNENGGS
jgi:hypothetical protein